MALVVVGGDRGEGLPLTRVLSSLTPPVGVVEGVEPCHADREKSSLPEPGADPAVG